MFDLLVALNYSAGVQSTWLLRAVLHGLIERPKYFAVLNADPGMESSESYLHVSGMAELCKQQGVEIIAPVNGPNLFRDGLNRNGLKRWDNPPLWTKNADGSTGRLMQKCTAHYKIAPMDREIRRQLKRMWGIPEGHRGDGMLKENGVVKWIGFAADEQDRVKEASQRYVRFRYPLIEMGMTKADIELSFLQNDWPLPPRSVCNGCPFNGLDTFRRMYEERPGDWKQAVAFDESIRDLSDVGVKSECFISKTLVPLRLLPEIDFRPGDQEEDHERWETCDSGYCFT